MICAPSIPLVNAAGWGDMPRIVKRPPWLTNKLTNYQDEGNKNDHRNFQQQVFCHVFCYTCFLGAHLCVAKSFSTKYIKILHHTHIACHNRGAKGIRIVCSNRLPQESTSMSEWSWIQYTRWSSWLWKGSQNHTQRVVTKTCQNENQNKLSMYKPCDKYISTFFYRQLVFAFNGAGLLNIRKMLPTYKWFNNFIFNDFLQLSTWMHTHALLFAALCEDSSTSDADPATHEINQPPVLWYMPIHYSNIPTDLKNLSNLDTLYVYLFK